MTGPSFSDKMIFSPVLILPLLLCLILLYERRRDRGLPPGPRRLPIIGNLHQAPDKLPWRTYQEWTKKYGPIFSVQYGLTTVIMLGTHESADALLNKRSSIYSSRPRLVMAGELVTKGLHVLLMTYGPRWRTHQKMQASCLNIRQSQAYRPLQDLESKQLMHDLVHSDDFAKLYHRYTASLMFGLAYGRRSPAGDEPEIKGADQVNANFLDAAKVGRNIVDALPVLNVLPAFLAPWKHRAERFWRLESGLHMSNLRLGMSTPSWNFTKQITRMKEAKEMPEIEVAYDIGIIYEAGLDTTNMALEIFTLAAVLNPEFVETARRELDAVVGSERLPNFDDQSNLPYITAVAKETLRWRPVSAGGIPHSVIADDEYMGYRIPKGATVIGNHWSIHMDETIFAEPQKFRPERWIENPNLPLHAFGFGRRVCTGQHVSQNSMFIIIARLLWTFRFEHVFENGVRVEIDDMAFTSGFNSRPLPFQVHFEPRSAAHKAIVEKSWAEADKNIDNILSPMGTA